MGDAAESVDAERRCIEWNIGRCSVHVLVASTILGDPLAGIHQGGGSSSRIHTCPWAHIGRDVFITSDIEGCTPFYQARSSEHTAGRETIIGQRR